MVKRFEAGQDSHTYQQALDDFSITQLLSRISNYSDADFDTAWMHLTQQELESIAALLIQQLTVNLKGNLIASYLNIHRNAGGQVFSDLPTPELKALSTPIALLAAFPQQTTAPLFWCGEHIRWIPQPEETQTNTGIIIGHFYAYAQHRAQWAWRYLIWLTDSSSLVVADTAWEQDVEPFTEESAR